jgi:sec-independent protein translocase protein TatC
VQLCRTERVCRTDDGQMTLVEHLTELRRRLIVSVIAVVACAALVFALYEPILDFLSGPYEAITRGNTGCGGTPTTGCDLIVTGPLDPFVVRLKIAGYGGIALAVPIIFWQIWRFVTPGLKRSERRYGLAFGLSAVGLFLLGVTAAWFTVEPALRFLLAAGGPSIQPFIAADRYLTLVSLMMLAFGVAFEFPLLIIFLLLVGIVNTRQLRQSRRWVAVGVAAFAAVITPSQDPISLMFMAIPMYVLYEIAILVGRIMKR